MKRFLAGVGIASLAATSALSGQAAPGGDYVIRNFKFETGETLPEVRIHYQTLGKPRRNAIGVVRNAVIVLHGTGGTGGAFMGRAFAGELFGPGQPLDTARYYVVLPDGIGHGGSSKPSDGLRAKFPKYKRVKNARFVLLPITDQTRGHGTHSQPAVWKSYLAGFLKSLPQ